MKRMGQTVSRIQSWRSVLYIYMCLTTLALFLLLVYPLKKSTKFTNFSSKIGRFSGIFSRIHGSDEHECPGVLTHMARGSWLPRDITHAENLAILAFLVKSEARYMFPSNYQRHDGKCGNVSHDLTGGHYANRFRALCDPLGMTPCCYDNICTDLSEYECFCDNCFDVRHDKHAEFSTWLPADPRCTFKTYTSAEACRLLRGSVLHLVGNSFIRHLHTAMLMVLSGDLQRGSLKPGISSDFLGQCSGLYAFTEKNCRHQVNRQYKGCGGSVNVVHQEYFKSSRGTQLKTEPFRDFGKPRTMLVLGTDNNDGYNSTQIQEYFLLPLLQEMKIRNRKWPKLLWFEPPAPGLLLMPEFMAKITNTRNIFNSEMETFLSKWDIPIFKTHNLTDGISSFDGEHYGQGVNIAIVHLLLSYIEELQKKGEW